MSSVMLLHLAKKMGLDCGSAEGEVTCSDESVGLADLCRRCLPRRWNSDVAGRHHTVGGRWRHRSVWVDIRRSHCCYRRGDNRRNRGGPMEHGEMGYTDQVKRAAAAC